MNKIKSIVLIMSALIITNGFSQTKPVSLKPYPNTKKVDQKDEYFGTMVNDPYRWLEDDKSEETADWVKQQNEVTFNYLDQIPFRKDIKNKLKEIWNFPKMSVPERSGDQLIYLYNSGTLNQDVLMMGNQQIAQGKILVDPNALSAEGEISITNFKVSNNGNYLAYSISEKGSDWNKIYVYDLKKMKKLDDFIDGVKFSDFAWKGNGFYYSKYQNYTPDHVTDKSKLIHNIFYHSIGDNQKNDQKLFDDVPFRNYSAYVDDTENYLIVSASESTSGNALFVKYLNEDIPMQQIIPSFDHDWEIIGFLNDSILVKTNYNAPNYQLVLLDPRKKVLDSSSIRVFLQESPDMVLKDATFAYKRVLVSYLGSAKSILIIAEQSGEIKRKIQLPGIGTVDRIKGWIDHQMFYFTFTSFTQPSSVYLYDLENDKYSNLIYVDLKFNPENYIVEQVNYKSFDQTEIPMFLVYKKGMLMNGSNPALLYGYGGFNISVTPSYSPSRMLFIDNGGILAVPSIRGGGEFGENWHKAGTKEKKQNVFNDFIAAAQYLIDKSYTSAGKIAIQGGSNGGLLVGACMTQRPELFKVALPAVGVLDMLRFHLFTIGWAWKTDYGSSEDEKGFKTLYKYSPLHNIKENVSYPATLVTTADHDDRVVPAHSFKFIATLQQKNKGSNPMLIRVQTNAGHGAGKSTTVKIDEATDVLSFLFYNLGMEFKKGADDASTPKDKKNPKKPSYINDPVYLKNKPARNPASVPVKPGNEGQPPKK
ncbi:MAG: prolyl oligopeptidase family protein [Bacteroidales bacterium]